MGKVTKELIEDFIRTTEIELSSSHAKLCIPIIDRIYREMSGGIKFSGIKVENGLICDGHHRYIAALLANFHLEQIPTVSTSATFMDWKTVVFEEEDWDTPAKIKMLNEQDANYNNIPIEQITDLLR